MSLGNDRLASQWSGRLRGKPEPTTVETVRSSAGALVENRPVVTTLIVFGLGVGLGTAIGMMMADSCAKADTNTSYESMSRHVMDAMSRVLPNAIARHFRL